MKFMYNISTFLQQNINLPTDSKITNERQEIIKLFVDELNSSREGSGYKKLAPGFIASKMYNAGLNSDFLLRWFYGYCKEAKNFSATWWWSMKPQDK